MARAPRTLGNENYENQEITSELDLVEEPEDSVEAHIVEVERAETATELEAIDGDQLDSDMDQLVRHAEVVETSMDDGGLDETAARQVDIAVESICNRWGFSRKKLGSENFRGSSSRIASTKLALEGIGDAIANGAKAFMDWILKKIQEVKHLWQKYVNVGKSSMKRIEKLRSKVDNLRGSAETGETIEGKKISKFIGQQTNVAKPTIVGVSKNDVAALISVFGTAVAANIDAATQSLGSNETFSIGENNATDKIMGTISSAAGGRITWEINGSEGKFKRLFPAGATDHHVMYTFGGIIIGYTDRANHHNLTYIPTTSEMIQDAEIPPLEPDQMEKVLDAAFDCAAGLNGYFRTMNKTDSAFDKLKREIKRAEGKYGKASDKKDVDADDVKAKRDNVKAARNKFDIAMSIDNIYRKVSVNFIQGSCAYVIESMKLYKDED